MAQQNRGKPTLPSASDWIDVEVPTRLPIIPLVSSVLFPGGVLSLQVGRDRAAAAAFFGSLSTLSAGTTARRARADAADRAILRSAAARSGAEADSEER